MADVKTDAELSNQPESESHWQVLGASVRGAAHERTGAPNQDAAGWWSSDDGLAQVGGDAALLVVADGHGGAGYTCSHIGARYGVKVARRVLVREVLPQLIDSHNPQDLARTKRTITEWLPKILVRSWLRSVHRHADRYGSPDSSAQPPVQGNVPDISAEKMATNTDEESELHTAAVEPSKTHNRVDPRVQPYGSTLLAALLTPGFHLYVQLGDGDMLTVDEAGQVSRPPLAQDRRLLANETTSLCSPEAWRYVRIHFQAIVDTPPTLILLSTDGYANSFASEAGFQQVASDLHTTLRTEGAGAVMEQLPAWLAATSAAGSGDDISVALAYRGQQNMVE